MEVTTINKGGRGKKASHPTTAIRIPIAIAQLLQSISDDYKLSGEIPSIQTCTSSSDTMMSKDEAIALAKEILSSKDNRKRSLEKLLKAIYAPPVNLD